MARAQRQPVRSSSISFTFSGDSGSGGGAGGGSELKVCPRCSVLIVKMDDGSCNHMTCAVCGSEFCWLCMKEISDLHYLSPSGEIYLSFILMLHLIKDRFTKNLIYRMHFLGKEAMEPQEEADVAAGHAGGRPGGDRADCGHLHPRHDHRDPGVGGQEDPQQVPDLGQAQEEHRHHQRGHGLGEQHIYIT